MSGLTAAELQALKDGKQLMVTTSIWDTIAASLDEEGYLFRDGDKPTEYNPFDREISFIDRLTGNTHQYEALGLVIEEGEVSFDVALHSKAVIRDEFKDHPIVVGFEPISHMIGQTVRCTDDDQYTVESGIVTGNTYEVVDIAYDNLSRDYYYAVRGNDSLGGVRVEDFEEVAK